MRLTNNHRLKKLDPDSLPDVEQFLHRQNPFDAMFFRSKNKELLSELWGSYDASNKLTALLTLGEESHNVLWKREQSLKPLASLVRSRYSITKTSGQGSKIIPWLAQFQAGEIIFKQEGYACVLTKDAFHRFPSPKVRKANLTDIERILWLFPKDPDAEQKKIELSIKQTKAFVLEESGLIVSIARTDMETPTGSHIVGVATHPDFRGNGFATCCVAALCNELLSRSQNIFLAYTTDNDAAGRVYNKIGFTKLAEKRVRARLQFN